MIEDLACLAIGPLEKEENAQEPDSWRPASLDRCEEAFPPLARACPNGARTRHEPKGVREACQPQAGTMEAPSSAVHRAPVSHAVRERVSGCRRLYRRARQADSSEKGCPARGETQTPVIAWYLEEHWDKLREISADKDSLQHTYAEWLANGKNEQRQAAAAGVNIETVIVHVDELQAWCRSQGWVINRKSRSRFVAHLLRSRAGQKELAANNPSPEQETAPAEEEVRNPPSY